VSTQVHTRTHTHVFDHLHELFVSVVNGPGVPLTRYLKGPIYEVYID